MAFFQKLKDRLFKSSSRIDEGLDAILEERRRAGAGGRGRPAAPAERRRAWSAGCSAPRRAGCSTTPCSKASRSC